MLEFTVPVRLPAEIRARPSCSAGFTLLELAIVLMIVGLLLSSLMPPLSAQIDQRRYNETQQHIAEIREALIGFSVAHGRLPRPAVSAADGTENSACADEEACTGFVPWVTLGVRKTDAWNKMIRYSVTPAYANGAITLNTVATKRVMTRDATGVGIYVVGAASACSTSIRCAPAIVYSAGKNHWGFSEDGTALPEGPPTHADERTNANANAIFITRLQSSGPAGGEFDDIVTWLPTYVLMNRMVAAGRLP